MINTELAFLFQQFGLAIQKLRPDDLALLLDNKASFDILVIPSPIEKINSYSKSKTDIVATSFDCAKIAQKLNDSPTREMGILALKELNRIQLNILAKYFSISVDSSSNKDKLIEKIVERKIGLRLRQDAFSQVMNTV